jgi:hypothetical protein
MKVALAQVNTAAVEEMKTIAPYPGDQSITRERIIISRKWALFYGGRARTAKTRSTSSAPCMSTTNPSLASPFRS